MKTIHKAFSLIELLIVIVIIGVVYNLSISNFKKLAKEPLKPSLANLKEYLQGIKHHENVKLLCLDDCSNCILYIDGIESEGIDSFLDRSVRTYKYEFLYGYIEERKEENICFSYEVNKNGVGNQVLVEFKNNYYDYTSYFDKTNVYSSLSEASEQREILTKEVTR